MLRTVLLTSSTLALLAAFALPALAEDSPTSPGARSDSSTPVRAKSILGARVSLKGGTSVGTVEDIVLNQDGVVDYLIVSKGGKLVTVPWDAARFNYTKRTATIDIAEDQFQRIPTYTSERYPNYYTPTYRNDVYKYYGLTPGQERRLERRAGRRP